MWKLALAVEEGDLADASAELDAIRKELQKALAEGASPERIAELMDKLREAMDRYLQSMAEETRRRMQQERSAAAARRSLAAPQPGRSAEDARHDPEARRIGRQ